MKKHYFAQTEDQKCTVLYVGMNLLVWVDEKCFMVSNPAHNVSGVKEVEFNPGMTIEQIKAAIVAVAQKE